MKLPTKLFLFSVLFCLLENSNLALAESDTESRLVKVGAIYGLTGPLADFSAEYKNGAELFVAENSNAPLSIVYEDSRWDPKTAVAVFDKLVGADKVSIVHVMGSGPGMAIKPLSERGGIILFSAGAHPDLLKDSHLVLRHANLASRDARVLAEAVAAKHPKKLATIYIQNEWGENFDRMFQEDLQQLLPNCKIVSESHLPNESDFRSQITKLNSVKPDVLMVNSTGAAAGIIIKQVRELGFKGQLYANNGLALSEEARGILRKANIKGFAYLGYPPVDESFRKAFVSRFGLQPGYFAEASYLDFELLSAAIVAVGKDTKKIVEFIKAMGKFEGKYSSIEISSDGDISINTSMQIFE